MTEKIYRGRLAPSPTGYLHLGHAMTFWRAQERAREHGGALVLRIEDLDRNRCRPEFVDATYDDLRWFGLEWNEGPDVGGDFSPYLQSERHGCYLAAWEKLRLGGFIYPCNCSRRDVLSAAGAPHSENEEPIYPGTCRPVVAAAISGGRIWRSAAETAAATTSGTNWRFRVPDGESIKFVDESLGKQSATAGKDFGDFIVWRKDDVPAYQLAVVTDDCAMRISEVVRGADLITSTFRQLLLYRALDLQPPQFYHAPLITDSLGNRLAKRHAPLSLRALREAGANPSAPNTRRATKSLQNRGAHQQHRNHAREKRKQRHASHRQNGRSCWIDLLFAARKWRGIRKIYRTHTHLRWFCFDRRKLGQRLDSAAQVRLKACFDLAKTKSITKTQGNFRYVLTVHPGAVSRSKILNPVNISASLQLRVMSGDRCIIENNHVIRRTTERDDFIS